MAKGKKTGGRTPGTQNKKTQEQIAAVEQSGITPLEFLLQVMRAPIPKDVDDLAKVHMQANRIDAAKAAAPYVHPKLSQVEMNATAKITQTVSADPLTEDEWEQQYGDLETAGRSTEKPN